ncbi:MAG TPA: hypothetical protein VGE67_08055, partial [Haloferula sp.]
VCDPERLTFEWWIHYDNPSVTYPYVHPGITGYDTPTLRIQANSLVRSGTGLARFGLRILRDGDLEKQQLVEVNAIVTDTTLPSP